MTTYFPDAQSGDCVAQFVSEPISADMLRHYADASGDSNPLHLDRSFAQKAGFDDVIVHGMLGMALLGRMLSNHFPAEDIRSLGARFLSTIPVGQRIHCQAEVAGREGDHLLLNLFARIDGHEQVSVSGQAVIGKSAI